MGDSIAEIIVQTIDGQSVPLSNYLGRVLLIVNVASYCGFTGQYKGLEALYQKYRTQGFEVLGFPCNDYGMQEPDSNEKIQQFCETRYGVTFPLFDKIHAKGSAQHPLYARLTRSIEPQGEVAWNFEKFLVDRQGKVIGRYKSAVTPEAPELIRAIEQALSS